MKAYSVVSGRVTTGIALNEGVVVIGEAGRARVLTRVPVPAGATVSGGVLTEVPDGAHPSGSVAVLIRDQSGFRGSWYLRQARTPEAWRVTVAAYAAHAAACDAVPFSYPQPPLPDGHAGGRYAIAACPACAPSAEAGQFGPHTPPPPSDLAVIAEGRRAQGLAGGMGGGPEYLLVLHPGQPIEIIREGRLYGAPSVLRLEAVAGEARLTDPAAAAESAAAASRW